MGTGARWGWAAVDGWEEDDDAAVVVDDDAVVVDDDGAAVMSMLKGYVLG